MVWKALVVSYQFFNFPTISVFNCKEVELNNRRAYIFSLLTLTELNREYIFYDALPKTDKKKSTKKTPKTIEIVGSVMQYNRKIVPTLLYYFKQKCQSGVSQRGFYFESNKRKMCLCCCARLRCSSWVVEAGQCWQRSSMTPCSARIMQARGYSEEKTVWQPTPRKGR